MSSGENNDVPTIEEILASIRGQVADRADAPASQVELPLQNTSEPGQDDGIESSVLYFSPLHSSSGRCLAPKAAPSNGRDSEQVLQSVAHAIQTAGNARRREDSGAARSGIDKARADLRSSALPSARRAGAKANEPEPNEPELWADASRAVDGLSSGAREQKAASLHEGGADEHHSNVSVLTSRATGSPAACASRPMPAYRDSLAVRLAQSRMARSAESGKSSPLPERAAPSRSYGPIMPVECYPAEAQSSSPEHQGALGNSGAEVSTTGKRSGNQGGQQSADAVSLPGVNLDETAIAVLRPLLRQWLESNIRPLLKDAIRAEMDDGTGNGKG